jgi:hypothetical protein
VFERDGFVRVPGAVAPGDLAPMRAAVEGLVARLRLVEQLGARRPAPEASDALWEIGRRPVFAPLAAALVRAVDGVFGAGVWAPVADQVGGLAAPNLPLPGTWNVPDAAWHVDEPTAPGQPRGWGLLGFAFLDEVAPGGGATVAIAGSHRRLGLVATSGLVTTDEALAELGREPWFAELLAPGDPAERRRRFLGDGHVSRGVPLRVVELTGAAGDLVLMDPRCLHTVSANVSPRPRLQMRLTCGRVA